MDNKIQQIINRLELQPHPEGGYFRETYRSEGVIRRDALGPDFNSDRNYSTCIYFLLTSANFSAFHRIKQDEIWHFYEGSPIRLHIISPDGDYSSQLIGRNFEAEQVPQFMVPAGYYFASEVALPDSFSLAGCTVAPGFDFADFELPSRVELVKQFPGHEDIITRLTHH